MDWGDANVMIAKDCGRGALGLVMGFAVAGLFATGQADAQQPRRSLFGGAAAAPAAAKDEKNPAAAPGQPVRLDQIDVPGVKLTAVPVNPTDPIAIVNGQVISRQLLADECVARKGKEILETLINRTLVDQALKARKQEVTAAEIDAEIDNVAHRFGISREAWLRTLDKERQISPVQYAKDIIYPALALRKLSEHKVTVKDQDLQEAFESQYGAKLRCRMIMVDKLPAAQDIWERLRKNPSGFEKIAQEESIDMGSRSLGGQLAEPITRHAYPRTVADAAFAQLVDGDPNDTDPRHKPKDGDITGPVQAAEGAWVILRREAVIPAVEGVSLKNEQIKKQVHQMIFEVKLKETMGIVFQSLIKAAEIENKLVGTIKGANEDQDTDLAPGGKADPKSLSNAEKGGRTDDPNAVQTGGAAKARQATPAGVPADAVQALDKFNSRPLQQSEGTPAPAGGPKK